MNGHGLSETVMNLFLETPNVGPLDNADGEGWAGVPDSGRFMRMQVTLDGDRVTEARFGTYGCAPAIAAGAFVTQWVRGRSVGEVREMTQSHVLDGLGGLPVHRVYCAALAVQSLQSAVEDALAKRLGVTP